MAKIRCLSKETEMPVYTPVQPAPNVTPSTPTQNAPKTNVPYNAPLLLRMQQAAEMLAVSRSKMYELVATGKVPLIKFGKSVRIPYATLVAWLDEQIVAAKY